MRTLLIICAAFLVAACGGGVGPRDAGLVTAAAPIDPVMLMQSARGEASGDYRIGATDLLTISVFQVPDLSFEEIRVDASGNLQMPLIGSVPAAGRTPGELSVDIARLLGDRYLRNPQVTVTVMEAASQKVTIDGAVTQPGVYEMRGRTTLMQAVAMAKGPLREADVRSVAVFREVGGQRMVAVFDLAAIRNGQAEDPVILGDDIVVVDTSRLSVLLRDVVQALPAVAAFAYF
jgi:polysaccharide biosynthesis/export protein